MRGSVAGLIDAVFPAIEIAANWYGDSAARGKPTLSADDFSHEVWVLRPAQPDWEVLDFSVLSGRVRFDGKEKASVQECCEGTSARSCCLARKSRRCTARAVEHRRPDYDWVGNAGCLARRCPLRRGDSIRGLRKAGIDLTRLSPDPDQVLSPLIF